jgi:hypothetical protein
MQVVKTAQGKVRLYDKKTGEMVERWPVDAKGMLNAGTHSAEPVDVAKGEDKQAGGEGGEQRQNSPYRVGAAVFDPVKTPTMDLVAGATSPVAPVQPNEAVLGAAMEVTALPQAETVPGASARELEGIDKLPKTTPLGAPAVHATSRGAAQTDQAPVRTQGKKK